MVRFILLTFIYILGLSALAVNRISEISDPLVRSVSLTNPDYFMAPPVIRMNTDDRLRLNFDIIGDAHEFLRYRLLHCNSDWQPSRLLESEYLNGFNEAPVSDFEYSSNTFVHYVNYNIMIPNADMAPLVSGNYIIQVYREDDPDDVILQTGFSVSENSAPMKGSVTSRTDKGFNNFWQQVMFEVGLSGTGTLNPYQDLIVTVTQNNRTETTRTVSHPLRVDGGKAVFDHDPNLIFPAVNEYRRFETVRIDHPGMHVDSVMFGGTNWHAWLSRDENRDDKSYVYDSTQHGRFMIDEYNATDPDLGADYVTVHFTLDSPEAIGADVFVDGDFTLHRFNDSNKMKYSYDTGLYTAEIPLKQGSYNYQYVVIPKSGGFPDASLIEGNFYETNNEYLVNVFVRTPGARADRLISSIVL